MASLRAQAFSVQVSISWPLPRTDPDVSGDVLAFSVGSAVRQVMNNAGIPWADTVYVSCAGQGEVWLEDVSCHDDKLTYSGIVKRSLKHRRGAYE